MGRSTWIAVEAGARDAEEHTLGRVERVLGWTHGTIARIAAGGEPAEPATAGASGNDWLARLETIRDDPRRSQPLRDIAAAQIAQVSAIFAAARAEETAEHRRTG